MRRSRSPLTALVQVRVTPALKAKLDAKADGLGLRTVDLARLALTEVANDRPITTLGVKSEATNPTGG